MNTEQRSTRQRQVIRDALCQAPDFVTAQQLHSMLTGSGESIGLATVYRALAGMAEAGQADTLRLPGGELAYRNCSAAHHHHLICRVCGRTVEVSGQELEAWAARVAAQYGFRDIEHSVEIYGICPDHAVSKPAGDHGVGAPVGVQPASSARSSSGSDRSA
jgi:Fur family ferric uptake transcriptional regulator